jgi:hypothetical protein
MVSKKAGATVVAEYGCQRGMKCLYMENLSTTVKMTYLPLTRGNTSMKSMDTSVHPVEGTSRG